jgi:spore maturation protein B
MTFREIADLIAIFILPVLMVGIPVYGLFRRVPVYEKFVEGAKDGFTTSVRIIPYLVAILFAIAMFRASGAMTFLQEGLRKPLSWIGMPPEVLPMAIVRPLTGSGSLAVLADLVKQYGPDSIIVKMAATIYGSTETTFYVLAVYFGAVNIRNTRHALPAGLIADACSILLSCWIIRMFFGH